MATPYKVGDRVKVTAVLNGGAIVTGSYPFRWDCPGKQAVPDQFNGPSPMIFTLVAGGTDVNLRFQSLINTASHVGALIDIEPFPPITSQGLVVEGKV